MELSLISVKWTVSAPFTEVKRRHAWIISPYGATQSSAIQRVDKNYRESILPLKRSYRVPFHYSVSSLHSTSHNAQTVLTRDIFCTTEPSALKSSCGIKHTVGPVWYWIVTSKWVFTIDYFAVLLVTSTLNRKPMTICWTMLNKIFTELRSSLLCTVNVHCYFKTSLPLRKARIGCCSIVSMKDFHHWPKNAMSIVKVSRRFKIALKKPLLALFGVCVP